MKIAEYRAKHSLSQAGFAALLKDPPATQALVSQWERGDVDISADRAIQIEKASAGEIGRSDLRPDYWPPSDTDAAEAA